MPVPASQRKVNDRVRRCQAIMMNYMCMKHNDTIHSNSNSNSDSNSNANSNSNSYVNYGKHPVTVMGLTANSERLYATSLGLEVSRCGASKKNGSIQKPGWHGATARPRESNEPQQDASRVENSESNERLAETTEKLLSRARSSA